VVLDADFFHYSPEVRHKIEEVFELMWLHDLKQSRPLVQLAKRALFETSRALHRLSPSLERTALSPVLALGSALRSAVT
jgi:hypothetical protein